MNVDQAAVLLITLLAQFILLLWAFVRGQLMMKAKIRRQIDWGIEHGRIKLEVDGVPKRASEMYSVICARNYPQA